MDDNNNVNNTNGNMILSNVSPMSATKARSGSVNDVPRYEETLSFVAGDTGTQNM